MGIFRSILFAAWVTVVAASPVFNVCVPYTNILATASALPAASTFCSSFLSIATVTKSTTSTVTPAAATAWTTVTVTNPNSIMIDTTVTTSFTTTTYSETTQSTIYPTVTSTLFSAFDTNCQLGAMTITSYPSPSAELSRRNGNNNNNNGNNKGIQQQQSVPTPACFQNYLPTIVSTLCSCLSIPTPVSTSTIMTQAATPTTTSTSYTTTASTTLSTTIITSTVLTSTTTTSTLAPTTSTVTSTFIQPTPSSFAGMDYYAYILDRNYLDPSQYANNPYWNYNGIASDIDFLRTGAFFNACALPGQPATVNCEYMVIVFQGYFFAPTVANYTFSTPNNIDNALGVWTGANAYGGYTNANADYVIVGPQQQVASYWDSKVYELAAGEFMPVTIMWANYGGPGSLYFNVSSPTGTVQSTAGWFVPPCPISPFTP